jgi:hypothetical protein
MEIDFSKVILKCNIIDDCACDNDRVCCVECRLFQDCIEKNWICVHLEAPHYNPENCKNLYLKNVKN